MNGLLSSLTIQRMFGRPAFSCAHIPRTVQSRKTIGRNTYLIYFLNDAYFTITCLPGFNVTLSLFHTNSPESPAGSVMSAVTPLLPLRFSFTSIFPNGCGMVPVASVNVPRYG